MKITGTRTFLELRVGVRQSVEVVLHVRRADIVWFNSHSQELFPEVLDVLQVSILPRLLASEIEQAHYRSSSSSSKRKVPPNLGPGGIPTGGGSSERPKSQNNTKKPAAARKLRMSKVKHAELKRQEMEAERLRRQSEKDVYYATTETIQVTYRLEAIAAAAAGHSSATLLFGTTNKNFYELQKLSQRILLWCYPIQDERIVPTDEGFCRPELVPMASIFRLSPREQQQQQQDEQEVIDIE